MTVKINLNSEDSCWRAYLNYHCYGNTMQIKPEEMGQITQAWEDRIEAWQKNNWRTAGKTEVKNIDLWKALLYEVNKHKVSFIKVKGHADVELNERCDQLARGEVERYQKKRYNDNIGKVKNRERELS